MKDVQDTAQIDETSTKTQTNGEKHDEPSQGHQMNYATPIGAFFCPEICALTSFGARFLQNP